MLGRGREADMRRRDRVVLAALAAGAVGLAAALAAAPGGPAAPLLPGVFELLAPAGLLLGLGLLGLGALVARRRRR
jgi:LPXTG-motif cell wall-anchored protein